MPKSKRNQVVHLTKVKKKGKDHKANLLETLQKYVEQFKYAYLFDINQEKSQVMFALRLYLKKEGHFWAGQNSMTVAGFRNVGSKRQINYADLVRHIKNRRGIYFTNLKLQPFQDHLSGFQMEDWIDRMVGYAELNPTSKSDDDHQVVSEKNDDNEDDEEKLEGFDSEEMADWKRVKFIPVKKIKVNRKKVGC